MSQETSATAFLRAATRQQHEAVDAAFSRFGLGTREGYVRFLEAHARVLPAAERALAPGELIVGWEGRSAALAEDLAALEVPLPPEFGVAKPKSMAERWGAIYVVEGSRLGGLVLSRTVPPDLPGAYLRAGHPPGAWRRFLAQLDQADAGAEWRAEAAGGAQAMFAAYLAAAVGGEPSRADELAPTR